MRFDLAARGRRAELALRERAAGARGFFGGHDVERGGVVKMEKMLVREDATAQKELPDDFDENGGQGVVSVNRRKWREYVVVCRRSEGAEAKAPFVLQIYKTRVIPALERGTSTKPKYEIPLDAKVARCNLYSSLDKTLVVWQPGIRGTQIFILQSPSASSSVEWLTFIRGILGFDRPTDLLVKVPEVDITLRIEDPFESLHADDGEAAGDAGDLLAASIAREEAVAPAIVERCLDMISKSDEWSDALRGWTQGQRVGLAWKRYDRLEWVHGAGERRMYGAMAMARSHDLELRPKTHYPTTAATRGGRELREPPAVEGFLVRLTSQSGNHRRFGRGYSRRLYFATFDQLLVFTAPRHGDPPEFGGRAPRRLLSARSGANGTAVKKPLVYEVDPFPVKDGRLEWLDEDPESVGERDRFAHHEFQRRRGVLEKCEGYIDLCSVVRVRGYHEPKPGEPEVVLSDDDAADEPDESDEEAESTRDNKAKIFELVLAGGLAVRLQAYSRAARREWARRLRELARYWRARRLDDVRLHRRVRARNLDALQVDEEGEAWVGAFARKWELARTAAEPALHSFCPATRCRAVLCAGAAYVKTRLRGAFELRFCVLVPGALMMFEAARRGAGGRARPHVHRARTATIALKGCYLYSGLLTEADLVYHDRGAPGMDAAAPGHHAVPRVWPADGWDGWDEDVMACFVLWRPGGRSWFRGHVQGDDAGDGEGRGTRLKRVSALGKKGNRVVFRARGRAERDRWVLALAGELERAAREVEVRIVGGD